jgi:hypothetical protein
LHRLLCIALLTLIALPAFGQYTRDTAAKKKIDEAINQHYVATDFEKAEGVLLGTINACADKCSPAVFASAWMYVGIVRGSGKSNQAGAKEAFQKAVAADPSVKLDTVLATPETQATFAAVSGGGAAAAPEPAEPEPAEVAPAPAAPAAEGGLACTPAVSEIETRRPVPVSCTSDEEATSMELKYKPFGSDSWKTLPMKKSGDSFRATIPCDATTNSGTLRIYVRAKDATGGQVDSWGSKTAPIEFALGEAVAADPPAFEGEEPPARCTAKEECPPDFPGCDSGKSTGRGGKDWGAECDNSTECKSGLLCTDGVCETAPSCETDADCETGTCSEGKCDIPSDGDDLGPKASYKKNWFGLNFAQDFAMVGGNNVCDQRLGQASENYACFYEGTDNQPFVRTPYPLRDGIKNGMVLATSRLLLSYDRAFTNRITLGVRAGYAFGGGPPAGQVTKRGDASVEHEGDPLQTKPNAVGSGGTAFLPAHIEVRGAFWFLPLNAKLLRAYVAAGGGMAQVDAKVSIPEYDCNDAYDDTERAQLYDPDGDGVGLTPFAQCKQAKGFYNYKNHKPVNVDGWKKMGQGFITIGAGGMLAFKDNMGVLLNVNFMYMLPASGVVIQPSLGFSLGL